MKKIYLFTIFALLTIQLSAQWTSFSVPSVTNLFRCVYFLNPDTGFLVGEFISPNPSPILKTTDAGATFFNNNSGTQKALRAIQFIDADTGYVVGFDGKLLQSTDGGIVWDTLPSGTIQHLRSIHFPSHNTGYICGSVGTVLKTTDAGKTWSPMNVATLVDLINIHFVTDDLGYVVSSAGTFDNGAIYKTIDGGITWTSVYADILVGFLGLAVVDANTVYAGGFNDVIVKTIDGGATWSTVYTGLAGHSIRSGFALDANTVWMGCDQGDIYYTNDGGASWTNQSVNTKGIFSIFFTSPSTGYACGNLGEVLVYGCAALGSIGAITGETSVCPGDSLQYSIDAVFGANNYSWSLPPGSTIMSGDGTTSITAFFGTASGNISVSASNGCDSLSTTLSVTVNPQPIATVTFNNNELSSNSATTYQWYYNGVAISGATDQTYIPILNGDYSVVITNSFGCEASSAPFAVIGVGWNEISSSGFLEITPNPLTSSAVIFISGNFAHQVLSITDVQGKIIREISVGSMERVTIEKKDFAEGMYFISLLNDQGKVIAKSKLLVQ